MGLLTLNHQRLLDSFCFRLKYNEIQQIDFIPIQQIFFVRKIGDDMRDVLLTCFSSLRVISPFSIFIFTIDNMKTFLCCERRSHP